MHLSCRKHALFYNLPVLQAEVLLNKSGTLLSFNQTRPGEVSTEAKRLWWSDKQRMSLNGKKWLKIY